MTRGAAVNPGFCTDHLPTRAARLRGMLLLAAIGVAFLVHPALSHATTVTAGPQTEPAVQAAWRQFAPTYSGTPYAVAPVVTPPFAPGRLQPGFAGDALKLINFARFVAGLPSDVTIDPGLATDAQYGAVLLTASSFSHTPSRPSGMTSEFYARAYRATSRSNIGWGHASAWDFELTCLEDSDWGNISKLGHRRWLLNPDMLNTGIGTAAQRYTTYAFDTSRATSPDFDIVAWPNAGAFPVQLFGSDVAWSITLNPGRYICDPSSASRVTLKRTRDGRTWTFDAGDTNPASDYFARDFNGFGLPNCFIFRPDPDTVTYRAGDEFEVTLSGGIFAARTRTPVTIDYLTRFVSLNPRDDHEPDDSRTDAATPRRGTLESRSIDNPADEDWFRFDAQAGTEVSFIIAPAGKSPALQADIVDSSGAVLASWTDRTAALDWTPRLSGRYYLRLTAGVGRFGSLRYTTRFCASSEVSLSGPATVAWGGTARLAGTIADAGSPLGGALVALDRSYDGRTWSQIATVTADAAGTFGFEVSPTRRAAYSARYASDPVCPPSTSNLVRVAPRVRISAPRLTGVMRRGRTATFSGSITPAHAAGVSVATLYFYRRENGAWVLRRSANARAAGRLGTTGYSAQVALPDSGRWRVRAYHADAAHAATYSDWAEFSVW